MQRIAGAVAADDVAPFPVWRTAEISRFSIVKSFRHHTPDQGFEAQLSSEEWRKMLFHLPLGLIKSCVEMSVREGMTHWAAVMEPALLRLLTRLGIHFNPLGVRWSSTTDGVSPAGSISTPCWPASMPSAPTSGK